MSFTIRKVLSSEQRRNPESRALARCLSPLPVRDRIKVRVLIQRATLRAICDSVLPLFFTLALSACAQQGGGLLQPSPKQIISGKNTIVPSAAALSMEATNFCNAQAQVDYAGLVLNCEGRTPALPLSITTTYQTESSQFSCQVYGYTNSSNQLIVPATVTLGNCPTGAAPAPVTAPSGASTAAAH